MRMELGEIVADVTLKDIKNIHLSVHPPTGQVRISAPERMKLETIRVFAVSKLDWIKRERRKFTNQEREPARLFVPRESHLFLGKRDLLAITESNSRPAVILRHREIELIVPNHAGPLQRQLLLERWYRGQLREILEALGEKWRTLADLYPADVGIKKMRTKWGSCNSEAGRIWLNLELAKKPRECIEYVYVHELVHLIQRNHGPAFIARMDRLLPQWRALKDQLNRLPVSHVDWKY